MELSAAALAALRTDAVRLDVFLFVNCTPTPIRAWTGAGNYLLAGDNVDALGGEYLGLGRLVGMPVLNQLMNGAAERIELVLGGVDADVLELADSESDGVRGAEAVFGIMLFDLNYAALTGVLWLSHNEADTPIVSSQPGSKGEPRQRQVSLSVGSAMTGRKRPLLSFYTGVEQRRRSATDRFCDLAPRYAQDASVRWPK